MTNYEKIKDMSVEQMAEFLAFDVDCMGCPHFDDETSENCKLCFKKEQMKKFLKSEAEE